MMSRIRKLLGVTSGGWGEGVTVFETDTTTAKIQRVGVNASAGAEALFFL